MADETGWQSQPPNYKPPADAKIQPGPAPVPAPPSAQPAGATPAPAPAPAPEPEEPKEFVGLPVRASGDRVFILKGGKKHWVVNPEAYSKLGFKFGDEARIDEATLAALSEGEPLK